jgi:hypothetical protein
MSLPVWTANNADLEDLYAEAIALGADANPAILLTERMTRKFVETKKTAGKNAFTPLHFIL